MLKKLCISLLIVLQLNGAVSKPFLYNLGETLLNLITAASSTSSIATPENSNIADLRTNPNKSTTHHLHNNTKTEDVDDDDDFFRIPFEKEETSTTEPPPAPVITDFVTKKIGKILRKIQFIQQLSNPQSTNNDKDADFDRELDKFDKDFDEDFNKNRTTIEISNKYSNDNNGVRFNPVGITVFFMEAIGSIVGLVYGAAAQLNHRETTTTNSVI